MHKEVQRRINTGWRRYWGSVRCRRWGNHERRAPWPKKKLQAEKKKILHTFKGVLYSVQKVCVINDTTVNNDRL